MTDLTDKIAWVTGGGSGVGAKIATTLAEAGAVVVISGRREEALQEVAARHPNISSYQCDVTAVPEVDRCCAHIRRECGGLDIVVANAGSASSAPFSETGEKEFTELFNVNVMGVVNVWQAALPMVRAAPGGRLIVTASTAGLKGYAYVSAYCAVKHAAVGLTKSVAAELAATSVTVNAICPGYVDTPMLDRTIENIMQKTGYTREQAEKSLNKTNPQHRFVQPSEVASAALWLCDISSGSVTGQSISLSGGEI